MTVEDFIKHFQLFDPHMPVVVSCEGGCVEDDSISIIVRDNKAVIEIE